jgi:hypothetical protein
MSKYTNFLYDHSYTLCYGFVIALNVLDILTADIE